MTYLPGLRASLVDAARKTYGDAQEPLKRNSRRRWPTGVATALAVAVAVAVALVAVVALGHHRTNATTAASHAITKGDLRRSAAEALTKLALPRGAVPSGPARGLPTELRSPSSALAIANHVDVYRVWRLREGPERVVSFIETHLTEGSSPGFESAGGSESASASSGPGGQSIVTQANGTVSLPATGAGIWRELALDAVRRSDGGTTLRVDSEAGWLQPRPADERIPSGVARVQLAWRRPGTSQHLSVGITNPDRIGALVSALNSLPAARPGTGTCKRAANGSFRFVFEGAGRNAPIAVALWAPPCQNLGLSIRGGPSVPVMAGSPTMPAGAGVDELLAQIVTRGRVPSSSTIVNSSQACAPTKAPSQAQSQSAPGAAGASCASVSHSTTSASSR